MIRVYVLATDSQNARERFAEAVRYAAGELTDFSTSPPELFMDAEDARRLQEGNKAVVEASEEHGGSNILDPAYVAFSKAAKVFTVEVIDVLAGEVLT